ncbi:GNAT family N-acetyltransferase [Subtercola endophyticus]|uniref:GNAT family N-acetyltransferase n=1 Tax=Subtercola endophyticus TaxID=2895559 RepID=UPI001E4E12F1|nr:GNAT family N-acetyltransferase [Subtercola endophyticus]UFS59929.1 GNAT family N-acetyltransferase [Subtercola endophyticus]
MSSDFVIRPAIPDDVANIAAVHVTSWRETYRGTLVSDVVLDSPDFLPSRERFWATALTDQRWAANRVRVAEVEGELVGIAMSGPVIGEEWIQHLSVLYVSAQHHGAGIGTALLDAVLDKTKPAVLWVGDPVPRAQAFYRKHGFVTDGTVKVEDNIRELRMRRAAR